MSLLVVVAAIRSYDTSKIVVVATPDTSLELLQMILGSRKSEIVTFLFQLCDKGPLIKIDPGVSIQYLDMISLYTSFTASISWLILKHFPTLFEVL